MILINPSTRIKINGEIKMKRKKGKGMRRTRGYAYKKIQNMIIRTRLRD